MPLRLLLKYLMHSEQVVQKLSESYPIRRAAQLTAFLFHKGKYMGQEGLEKFQESDVIHKIREDVRRTSGKLESMKDNFTKDVKDGFKEIDEKFKRQK